MAKAKAQGKMIANIKKRIMTIFILDTYERELHLQVRSKIPPHGKMQHQRILYPY